MEFFHKVTAYPFMHTRRIWYGVSGAAIIASIGLLLWHGLNLGIDFTGGVVLEFAYPKAANLERTRACCRTKSRT
jgi:preprotein translocase subunit SecF